jgi:hypothetical protein
MARFGRLAPTNRCQGFHRQKCPVLPDVTSFTRGGDTDDLALELCIVHAEKGTQSEVRVTGG